MAKTVIKTITEIAPNRFDTSTISADITFATNGDFSSVGNATCNNFIYNPLRRKDIPAGNYVVEPADAGYAIYSQNSGDSIQFITDSRVYPVNTVYTIFNAAPPMVDDSSDMLIIFNTSDFVNGFPAPIFMLEAGESAIFTVNKALSAPVIRTHWMAQIIRQTNSSYSKILTGNLTVQKYHDGILFWNGALVTTLTLNDETLMETYPSNFSFEMMNADASSSLTVGGNINVSVNNVAGGTFVINGFDTAQVRRVAANVWIVA